LFLFRCSRLRLENAEIEKLRQKNKENNPSRNKNKERQWKNDD
jgi:hypothetical protein